MSEMENPVQHSSFTNEKLMLLKGKVTYTVTLTVLMATILAPCLPTLNSLQLHDVKDVGVEATRMV